MTTDIRQVRNHTAPSGPSRASFSEWSPVLFSVILGLISLAVWWRPLTSTFALALHDDQYTHILLILPISAALIFLNWKSPTPATGRSMSVGAILLLVAILTAGIVRWRALDLSSDIQLSLNMLAAVLWWILAFLLCFGDRAFRRTLFPLCFLFWMVLFPPSS